MAKISHKMQSTIYGVYIVAEKYFHIFARQDLIRKLHSEAALQVMIACVAHRKTVERKGSIDRSVTEIFVEQPLALPGSAKKCTYLPNYPKDPPIVPYLLASHA